MRVRIDSAGGSTDSRDGQSVAQLTADFADWLSQDRAVGPHVEIRRIRPEPTDGAMSSDLVEWLSLAVSSGFSAAALVYAHRTFRASLPPRLRTSARMVIEHGDLRVVVENGNEQDAVRIARALTAETEPTQPDADGPPSPPASAGTPPEGAGNAGS
ncbi:effector-associated constant component EACC1 [Streptomyces sp. MB09-02B]|uniref:effector-associated constant component EACC1 n=1 Tax=Streptomyces sp. MB09-02B TaxID=3028667 RepID=UPI0029C0BB7D|nr:hypothetical protein [Streptomyces sp. MB09-02B]